jgi:predicted Co/Zn/Cd cation transporter (cation efflux family)
MQQPRPRQSVVFCMEAQPSPKQPFFDLSKENGVLRVSIAITIFISALGILFGLASGSFSILFDGVYSLVDALMTILSLLVVNLIALSAVHNSRADKLNERFSMGLWHLEPMMLGLNGLTFMLVGIYALFNAVITMLNGGRHMEFGPAITYAAVTLIACAATAILGHRANRKIKSDFITLDVSGWVMSAGISAALLIAFITGYAVKDTPWAWIAPYVDPAILAVVCLILIPVPFGTVRQAFADILLVTPADLKEQVDQVARRMVERHGFLTYRAYVARIGRARQIELYFIIPYGLPPQPIPYWDGLRDEIGEMIGGEGPNRWLTVTFTCDLEWAE